MGDNFNKDELNIGGSIFWILLILISLAGLMYLLIWSFHNDSIKGAVVSTIFITMITSGVLLSRLKVFDFHSWGDNALSFTIGFFVWMGLGSLFTSQSVLSLSVSKNYLFATISSELPQLVEVITNVFIVPIAEEIFWMIGMPFALITILNQMGKKWDIFSNEWLQMFIVIAIASSTFAVFHVGKAFISFIIAAIIFRTIMIVMVYGEHHFDMLKGINLVSGFAVGAHIANNMLDTGIQKTWLVLQTSLPVLIIVIVVFGALFLSAADRILRFFTGKASNLEDS